MVFRRSFALIVLFASCLTPCFAADGNPGDGVFTITVTAPTLPKDVQVRYFLGGDFGVVFASSTATSSADKIVIRTTQETKTATRFRAIAFAPGCQFVTFTVDELSTSNRQGDFQCQKLPTTMLQGRVPASALSGKDLQVQVLYVCNWAAQFFNMGQGAISPLFLAKAQVGTDGSFAVELPDFASDPLWSSLSKDASLNFFLIDPATGHPLMTLAPPADMAQGNSLKVATTYSGEIQFEMAASGKR